MDTHAQFEVGQLVKAVSFVDCFGKAHAEVPNLIVTRLRYMASTVADPMFKPYYRVTAEAVERNAPTSLVEGAESFFARMLA